MGSGTAVDSEATARAGADVDELTGFLAIAFRVSGGCDDINDVAIHVFGHGDGLDFSGSKLSDCGSMLRDASFSSTCLPASLSKNVTMC